MTIRIRDFYRGKSVFLTGATGFIGKLVAAKLLKSCPEVDKIFLLIRASSLTDCQRKYDQLLSSKVFEHTRQANPSLLRKLQCVHGDITEPFCGISEKQLSKVDAQVFIHSAASINFALPLLSALRSNTLGTKNVLDVAKQSNKIEAFVYISTAFLMSYHHPTEEIVYPTDMDAEFALESFPKLPPDWLAAIERIICKDRISTYLYTKHLSESLVSKLPINIPAAIIRPSAILAAYEEPFPGWNEANSGFTYYNRKVFSGVLKKIWHDPNCKQLIGSADHVVNAILASAWRAGTSSERTTQVYNAACPLDKMVTHADFLRWGSEAVKANPYPNMKWAPNATCTRSERWYRWSNAIFRIYPALFRDLLNGQIRGGLVDEIKGVERFTSVYHRYTSNNWDFKTKNLQPLENMLGQEDKNEFPLTMEHINWETFTKRYADGIRIYDNRKAQM